MYTEIFKDGTIYCLKFNIIKGFGWRYKWKKTGHELIITEGWRYIHGIHHTILFNFKYIWNLEAKQFWTYWSDFFLKGIWWIYGITQSYIPYANNSHVLPQILACSKQARSWRWTVYLLCTFNKVKNLF